VKILQGVVEGLVETESGSGAGFGRYLVDVGQLVFQGTLEKGLDLPQRKLDRVHLALLGKISGGSAEFMVIVCLVSWFRPDMPGAYYHARAAEERLI